MLMQNLGVGANEVHYGRCQGAHPHSQGSLSWLEGLCHGGLDHLVFNAKGVALTSFQKPLLQSLTIIFKFAHPYFLLCWLCFFIPSLHVLNSYFLCPTPLVEVTHISDTPACGPRATFCRTDARQRSKKICPISHFRVLPGLCFKTRVGA